MKMFSIEELNPPQKPNENPNLIWDEPPLNWIVKTEVKYISGH